MVDIYKKHVFKAVFITLITLLFAILPSNLCFLSYVFLLLCLIFKYKLAPIVFLNLCFLVLGNEALFVGLDNFGFFKYLIIFIFVAQSLVFFPKKIINNFYFICFCCLFFIVFLHSIFFSYYPLFSILKIILWFLYVICFSIFFYKIDAVEKKLVLVSSYSVLVVVILLSLILHFIPPIGYFLNGVGLQGITNQPQVFGSISGIFAVISMMLFLKNKNYIYLAFLVLSTVAIYLSQARTAALAFVIAICFLILQVFYDRFFNKKDKIYSNYSLIFLVLFLIITPMMILLKLDKLIDFINKRGEAGITNLSDSSRSVLIDPMIKNIEIYGLTGIGFGVPSDLNFTDMIYLPVIYLPISLPTEKGVFYIANIEELGFLFGFITFLILFIIFKKNILINWYAPIIIFIFTANLAENTFFSIGGAGMLFWVFACISIAFVSKMDLAK
ncbi:O-antigen ligase family protein [Acinetobacter lwoffii]|jgi:hypothetical protein|uniref:O-antigen ligase family protein n=1 Tax=Acinetobacter lwoffii TaxID=28090 RepID=UPI003F91BC50